MAYFTEIFRNNNKEKFKRIPAWLVTREGIVTPNIRDLLLAERLKLWLVQKFMKIYQEYL